MTAATLEQAQLMARQVTDALGGQGIFGVELFVAGDAVIFSEVSPRPHDTGMVTMISQDLSQFALHVRAVLGLPIPVIRQRGPSASSVLLVEGESSAISYGGLGEALAEADTEIRLLGKPNVSGWRRMGVALARGATTNEALVKAIRTSSAIEVDCG